jgi:hypothetical protein
MQDVVDALDGASRDVQIGQISLHELDVGDVRKIAPLAGGQIVHDADALPAADKFLRQMRTDETGAAGDEVMGHNAVDLSKNAAGLDCSERRPI